MDEKRPLRRHREQSLRPSKTFFATPHFRTFRTPDDGRTMTCFQTFVPLGVKSNFRTFKKLIFDIIIINNKGDSILFLFHYYTNIIMKNLIDSETWCNFT